MRKKVVFLVIDGLADLPINGKTPLSEARKPNLDWLAKNGITGEMNIVSNSLWKEHVKLGSHTLNIALLGYDPKKFPLKRGPLEAVGADIPYTEGHLAIRCNFATVDKELVVVDRRAGRNSYGLDDIIRCINQNVDIGVPFTFLRTYEHRAVLIIKEKLSDEITSNDPYKTGEKIKRIQPLKPEAEKSAKLVQEFVDKSHEVMEYYPRNAERIDEKIPPANYILIRQAGNKLYDLLPHFTKRWKLKNAVCISEKGVMKATCMLAGFNAVTVPELPFEETLDFIFENISEVLSEYGFAYAHIKGPIDEAAHDGDFKGKVKGIKEVDKRLEAFKKFDGILVVTCDHITSTEHKAHMPGKVPILIFGKGKDKVDKFDEFSVKKGKLKNYTPKKLWKFVFA
jgi:2,3-bisphosphoglycerate-independent phosphoglycerate mutase